MTLRQQLQEQFHKDLSRAPKSYVNQKGVELKLDESENIYIGYDKAPTKLARRLARKSKIFSFLLHPAFHGRREWIASMPLTRVPLFFVNCDFCRSPNIVGVWEHGRPFECRKCSNCFHVTIVTPVPHVQDILRRLDSV